MVQGWWAAIREGDNRVGWIPSSYVEPLSYELDGDNDDNSLYDLQTSRGHEFMPEVMSPESVAVYEQSSIISPSNRTIGHQLPHILDDKVSASYLIASAESDQLS